MIKKVSRNLKRQKRHLRVRKIVKGTAERPRLSVYRSNKAIYVQLIDDVNQVTLAQANTNELGLKGSNVENATKLGTKIAEKAKTIQVEEVVFDRGGYLYHGKIKALAEAAREAGLKF